jgi:hypothetical protein
MSNLRDNPGARSMSDIKGQAKRAGSFQDRQQGEQSRLNGPRRWRRQSGRSVFVAIRTYPEVKALIEQIADKHEMYLGEVVEEAIDVLKRLDDLADAESKSLGEVLEELVDSRYQTRKGQSK